MSYVMIIMIILAGGDSGHPTALAAHTHSTLFQTKELCETAREAVLAAEPAELEAGLSSNLSDVEGLKLRLTATCLQRRSRSRDGNVRWDHRH